MMRCAPVARICRRDHFHKYTADETQVFERVRSLNALLRRYDPKITVIQANPARSPEGMARVRSMAARGRPRRQARQLLRHTVADLLCGVEFTSYFSALDMLEGLNGKVGDKSVLSGLRLFRRARRGI